MSNRVKEIKQRMNMQQARQQRLFDTRKPRRTAIAISAAAGLAAALLLSGGCETGRTNKAHAAWQHLSDDTTTSKPEFKQPLGPGDHQPPVPGSPTAAGPDGNQPPDDMQARARHGNEYGEAAAPHSQPASSPEQH